uniref:RRP15-like protein n=1 Tax=Phaeodactylum tricornutum TaxID=2850 RepID=A0A8J9T4S9_PHATR
MVRHHTKNKHAPKNQAEQAVVDAKQLDRFAGSSEESAAEDDDVSVGVPNATSPIHAQESLLLQSNRPTATTKKPANDREIDNVPPREEYSADEESKVESEHDDDGDAILTKSAGMASAMSRILGTDQGPGSSKTTLGAKPVVLAKTTTPLQRQAAREKESVKAAQEKRRANRERTLQACHVPLSVATTSHVDDSNNAGAALVQELEQERSHRRVATRGVVALFNAIAQHQHQVVEPEAPSSQISNKKDSVKKLTKHGFLDMIKSKAAAQKEDDMAKTSKGGPDSRRTTASDAEKPQWNALQDDYLMNPKKNWDQEDSSEEDGSGNESKPRPGPPKKARKAR